MKWLMDVHPVQMPGDLPHPNGEGFGFYYRHGWKRPATVEQSLNEYRVRDEFI